MPGTQDDDRDEGFLGRWARRKTEAQQPARAREDERPITTPDRQFDPRRGDRTATSPLSRNGGEVERGPAPQPTSVGSAPSQPSPVPGEGSRAGASSVRTASAPSEPETVEPPSLDLVDKDFDLAHWLKQNVPEEWKLKALRRAWESDPAIADYLDPARDYALDWNTPGGAPGYGPLSESDDVAEMLAGIFGQPPEPEAGAEDVRPSSNDAPEDSPPMSVSAAEPETTALRLSATTHSELTKNASIPVPEELSQPQPAPTEAAMPARSRRRGGGATPL